MDSYLLTSLLIKSVLIVLGLLLAARGKQLKNKGMRPISWLPPNAMIVIGLLIVALNVLQILWLLFGSAA